MTTYEDWKEEHRFIESVNPRAPGVSFNHDPECFARYCNMQANCADVDGFHLVAEDIRQARDIADPEFRTKTQAAGGAVYGTVAFAADMLEHVTDADYPAVPEFESE